MGGRHVFLEAGDEKGLLLHLIFRYLELLLGTSELIFELLSTGLAYPMKMAIRHTGRNTQRARKYLELDGLCFQSSAFLFEQLKYGLFSDGVIFVCVELHGLEQLQLLLHFLRVQMS